MVPATPKNVAKELVAGLAGTLSGPAATNFYAETVAGGATRRHNLQLYLEQMLVHEPEVLLVGEAPGYRGTRITGVPFADERVLLEGVPSLGMLGLERGYRPPETTQAWRSEQTSTIVWEVLTETKFLPFLWAAFPFHPHQRGADKTNRQPTSAELALGRPFLDAILNSWRIKRIVAVGNVAERTLRQLGMDEVERIRHPARGGKREFAAGIKRIARADAVYVR